MDDKLRLINGFLKNYLMKIRYLFLGCVLCLLLRLEFSLEETSQLVLVEVVFRHGGRYPSNPSPIDGSNFADVEGSRAQLTKQGKAMHYYLGRKLYDVYWKQLFTGTPYENSYNQSKFYVKSTDINRTVESAESFMYGLLQKLPSLELSQSDLIYSTPQWPGVNAVLGPVFGENGYKFHPVVIHADKIETNIYNKGSYLLLYEDDVCPNQRKWTAINQNSKEIKDIVNNLLFVKAVQEVSAALKTDLTFWQVNDFIDNAQCMLYMNRPNVLDIFLKPSETKRALDSIYLLDYLMRLFYQPIQLATTATGFFNATLQNFKRIIQNQNAEQWIVYSGHDTTIMSVLATMNMTNVNCAFDAFLKNITKDTETCVIQFPNFASNIVFQLYEQLDKQYRLKIRYNGVYRKIPFCEWQLECSMNKFEEWFQSWKDVNFIETCGIQNQDAQYYMLLVTLEFGLILLGLVVALIILYANSKRNQEISKESRSYEEIVEKEVI